MSAMPGEREHKIKSFLKDSGWDKATRAPLAGDASTRRYERLRSPGGASAILMDAPPAAEAPACPPGASEADRRHLGYNALACLAGPDCAPFVAIDTFLTERALSAPVIRAMDLTEGLLLLEDLGDDLFAAVVGQSADEGEIYRAAVEVLLALHKCPPPTELAAGRDRTLLLHPYDSVALLTEAELLTEWFAPAAGCQLTSDQVKEYRSLWMETLGDPAIESDPVLVLRDFHAQNLLWLPGRAGAARVGLLDFQDAVLGSPAYDLVSLLQDARRDISPALETAMLERYCEGAQAARNNFDRQNFLKAYAVLGVQRSAKIVGIFARLAKRDGKPVYVKHLPRVWRYITSGLEQPGLEKLKAWFDVHLPPDKRGIPKGLS